MLSNYTNQFCYDLDECAIDNGGCGSHVTCVNTPVSSPRCLYEGHLSSFESGRLNMIV